MSLPIHFPSYPGSFTSFLPLIIPMSLLLHSLGFLSTFTSSLSFFYSCGLSKHQSCHFNLLGLFSYSFTIFPFSHSLYCWASFTVGWYFYCANPFLHQFFAQDFVGPLSTSLPLLGFIGQHSCCASPFHYFIPQASLTHLLLLYLFYSHRFFARFFGLP